jgi:hypothetical protein
VQWLCRRVELNAFSAPGLVAFTDRELLASGVRGKVVPPAPVLAAQLSADLRAAVRQAAVAKILRAADVEAQVEQQLRSLQPALDGRVSRLVPDVTADLADDPTKPWLTAVADIAARIAATAGRTEDSE